MQQSFGPTIRSKILLDLTLLALIIYFILKVHSGSGLIPDFNDTLLTFLLSLTLWLVSGRWMGLYKDYREIPFSIEFTAFLKTLILYGLTIAVVFLFLLKQLPFVRTHLLLQCGLIFALFPIQKVIFRIGVKKIRNSNQINRKVLIVGAHNEGINFYSKYVKNKQYGYSLAGFIDDEINHSLNGHYLGKINDIDKVIANHDLDDIIVTMPLNSEEQITRIISVGEKEGKRIRIIPDYQRFGTGRIHVGTLGNTPIITLRSLPLDNTDNKILKRVFDIVFSTIVIITVLSWLIPLISLLIKAGSKGPVFFKQERWGLNNKSIICYKFRTMVVSSKDVDENGRYQQATKKDPRITKIGSLLRKTNLDELPQFFNVFMGSMSVVGPRPHPVPLNIQSKDEIQNYMMRHWAKPGITGWAQVNGYRGETRQSYLMKKRVEFDVWYLENWTFWLDVQIIMQTLVNMVKGEKNAF